MQSKIFYNGNIFTQDKKNPHVTAFVIENNKFIAVGEDENILQLRNDTSEIIDLQNKVVLPGLNDAHIHIWKVGNLLTHTLDLRGVTSIEEMLEKLHTYQKNNPQLNWIQARGFNEANFSDNRMPDKNDLDTLGSDKPICVTRTCAHQIIVNSKALAVAGVTKNTPVPAGGDMKRLQDGQPSGHFTETAIGLILQKIPRYTDAAYREMILAAQDALLKVGITSATDPAVEEDIIDVYRQMDARGELKIRINLFPIRVPDGGGEVYPLPEKYFSEHLKIDTVKFFADGGLSGKTAALKRTYKDSDEKGVLRLDKNYFHKLAQESQDAGFRIATHAIGDAAIEMVLDVYKAIAPTNKDNINHRIEHLGLPTANNLRLMKELNISAVMQPVFIYELGNNFRKYLPQEYLQYVYPIRSVLEHGITLSLSSDAPVVKDFSPGRNIASALYRKDISGIDISPTQNISLEEAVYAYTMGSAIANGDQNTLGSIEKGKYADFIILSSTELQSTAMQNIEAVYVGGLQQNL